MLIFILSVFLMINTKPALYLWQNVKHLNIIDIPWRLLGVSTLSLAFIAAFVGRMVKPGLLIIILVFAVIVANRNHLKNK